MPALYSWTFGRQGFAQPASQLRSFNFANTTIEDPLSVGGRFSNNTQGVGGNVAPGMLSSMQVALAANGTTKVAMGDNAGQASGFADSFAFLPNIGTGDIVTEAVLYVFPGYNPNGAGGNHELEQILFCSTGAGTHQWMECLLNAGGGSDFLRLNGDETGFTSRGGQLSTPTLADFDVWRCQRINNVYAQFINGTKICEFDSTSAPEVGLGNGAGIAAFRRASGGETNNKFCFRSWRVVSP